MSLTFLIVDDDPDLRYLVNLALTRWGHRALMAETVAEARLLCADAPDVLLLDVTMPDMDGPAFLRSLRDDRLAPDRVYLVSALEPDHLAELAADLDVGYLLKPFTLQSLREGLADVLDEPGAAVPIDGDGRN